MKLLKLSLLAIVLTFTFACELLEELTEPQITVTKGGIVIPNSQTITIDNASIGDNDSQYVLSILSGTGIDVLEVSATSDYADFNTELVALGTVDFADVNDPAFVSVPDLKAIIDELADKNITIKGQQALILPLNEIISALLVVASDNGVNTPDSAGMTIKIFVKDETGEATATINLFVTLNTVPSIALHVNGSIVPITDTVTIEASKLLGSDPDNITATFATTHSEGIDNLTVNILTNDPAVDAILGVVLQAFPNGINFADPATVATLREMNIALPTIKDENEVNVALTPLIATLYRSLNNDTLSFTITLSVSLSNSAGETVSEDIKVRINGAA